jgi:hypothetical protein
MSRLTDIIDYYVNLLIIQYHNKPNARATIDAIASELMANDIYTDVLNGYDVDTAVGVQLDVIGKYADIDRFYFNYELTDYYFGFADAADIGGTSANIVGFDDAASPDKEGLFLDAFDVVSNKLRLNDAAYRTLIKLRIIQNHSTHDTNSISSSLFQFFGDDIIMTDNYDMTITYFIGENASELIQAAIQKEVLPRPAAVGLQVIDGNKFFGFADATDIDKTGDYVVGFNDATTFNDYQEFLTDGSGNILTDGSGELLVGGAVLPAERKEGGFLNANTDIL